MVPPNKGCGWQTSAACVASGWPSFSRASSRPAGPSRKKDLIPLATIFFTTEEHGRVLHFMVLMNEPLLDQSKRPYVWFSCSSVLLCVLCGKACYPVHLKTMDPIKLTRRLIDIESISGNEGAVGAELYDELCRLGYAAHKMPVAHERFNVVATIDERKPDIVFSTHMDTVPPFIPSSEDHDNVYGRGSCDAKGIIAAQIAACQRLRKEGAAVGMLFLVGEERDSLGAKVANENALGSRFLINGEPTENKIATASKGALRLQLTAKGQMAHSAYPELGESAIEKLLTA